MIILWIIYVYSGTTDVCVRVHVLSIRYVLEKFWLMLLSITISEEGSRT